MHNINTFSTLFLVHDYFIAILRMRKKGNNIDNNYVMYYDKTPFYKIDTAKMFLENVHLRCASQEQHKKHEVSKARCKNHS